MQFVDAIKFGEPELAMAVAAMRDDGIVCLREAISSHLIEKLNAKLQADIDVRMPNREVNRWNSLRPPPFHPFLEREIVYNEAAIDVCRAVLGPDATLTTYGANTSWPGQEEPQRVHRDVPDGEVTESCPAVVLNMPMTAFTLANGATKIYPGSHLTSVAEAGGTRQYSEDMLRRQAEAGGCEQTVGIGPGDIVVRDLRLWHGGMPNISSERRIMLALVVINPHYRGQDESAFKGFEAEQGSEAFWKHSRLKTSVWFRPAGDRSYHLHGHHSTPPTPLREDWLRRHPDPG
jgi:ectoine hydroxylase-related dioxygenase (phytanoyl-CoA dioxygenase family)